MERVIKTVYLAGPDVFYPYALRRLNEKANLVKSFGFNAIIPLDAEVVPGKNKTEQALSIYQENIKKILLSDIIMANMSPFRGPHLDPGTAFEIGFAVALKKQVVCYSENPQELRARVVQWVEKETGQKGRCRSDKHGLRDHLDLSIEDFGFCDNLMIEGAVLSDHLGGRNEWDHAHSPMVCFSSFEEALKSIPSSKKAG